jgi:hypothetical protein
MGGLHVFSAKIYKVGMVRFVDVPARVSRAIGGGAPNVAVRGQVRGLPVRTTLLPRGRGLYRMAIHGEIRKKLSADAGAVVEISIAQDPASREPTLPPALALAFRNSKKPHAAFRGVTTALRRQMVRYVTSVKQAATLERRAAKLIGMLEQRKFSASRATGRRKASK